MSIEEREECHETDMSISFPDAKSKVESGDMYTCDSITNHFVPSGASGAMAKNVA